MFCCHSNIPSWLRHLSVAMLINKLSVQTFCDVSFVILPNLCKLIVQISC